MSIATTPRTIPFGRPWITDEDRQAVMEVLEGTILTHGPRCHDFEEDFAKFMGSGAKCVSVSSGMAALHLASLHFGWGPGDEIICPAMTHIATIHAIEWVGARPVFIDCDPATGNITAERIAAAITSKTKGISLVHFQGIPCNMPEICKLAEKHNLKIVEDCALAIGAKFNGQHVGTFGDCGCYSLYPVKHITAGEGGMFATKHESVAKAVALLRAFGVDRRHDQRTVPGMYDVPAIGLNYRMSELQAALGKSQLSRVQIMLDKRKANFATLKEAILTLPNTRVLDIDNPLAENAHYAMTVVLTGKLAERRNDAIFQLRDAGIGTSVYYPQPTARMTYYKNKYGYDARLYPNAETIADRSIAFPVGPHIEEEDMSYLIQQTRRVLTELNS